MSAYKIFSPDDDAIKRLHELIVENFHATINDLAESTRLAILLPSANNLAQILTTTFWASLIKEEGRLTRPCVFFGAPHANFPQWTFQHKIPLAPGSLAKLASGTDTECCYVGIESDNDGHLVMWGISPEPITRGVSVQAIGPGYVLVKQQYQTIAIFKPDQEPILLNEQGSLSARVLAQGFLQRKFSGDFRWEHVDVLLHIAKTMAPAAWEARC